MAPLGVRLPLVACLLLAGCGGLVGSTPDCPTTSAPTPRGAPPVLVVIDNEQVRTHTLAIRATHLRPNGTAAVLFDSTVGLAPTQHLETSPTFPSREGRYRVRAAADNATGTGVVTVPPGRLAHVRVHITVHERDAPARVTVTSNAVRPTGAC